MLTGIFSTLLLPETKGKSLEELSNEDQDHFIARAFLFLLPPSFHLSHAFLGAAGENRRTDLSD